MMKGNYNLPIATEGRASKWYIIFAPVVVLAILIFGPQSAKAYGAPWCAVISEGFWDCQYHSFEDCYRRGNILGGNRGFCNPSPYYVANAAGYTRSAKHRASPQ